MTQTLELDGTLPDLNTIIKLAKSHYKVYANNKRVNTQLVAYECKIQKLQPIEGISTFHFAHYRPNRRVDPDNATAAQKYILDGLIVAKILPDDSMRYVKTLVHTFDICKKNPRILVTIYDD
jgi:hypothetical protein